jgi:hypothetical protein
MSIVKIKMSGLSGPDRLLPHVLFPFLECSPLTHTTQGRRHGLEMPVLYERFWNTVVGCVVLGPPPRLELHHLHRLIARFFLRLSGWDDS